MDHFLVFSCLLAVVAGASSKYYNPNGVYDPCLPAASTWPAGVYSKREAIAETVSPATTEDLYQLINEALNNITKDPATIISRLKQPRLYIQGISGDDLRQAAQSIQEQADAILEARGANVSTDDVRSLVQDIVTRNQINSSAADIIDDPLTAEERKIEIAIKLLFFLIQDFSGEATGEPSDVTVAAISVVAEVLESSITKTEIIITFIAASQHPDDDDDGDDDEARNINKRKEGGKLEVSGGYNSKTGWEVKASVTFTFGRR